MSNNKINIIVLNGASSSGKTSLARALQDIFEEPYLRLGTDIIHATLPDRFRDRRDAQSERMVRDAITGMHRSAAIMADAGNNVIVDTVMINRVSVGECAQALARNRAFFIGLFCSDEVLRKRAAERGEGMVNIALHQARHVHKHSIYDLKINTEGKPPNIMAEQIKNLVNSRTEPEAFKRLSSQYKKGGS